MKLINFKHTKTACYIGYIVQAIIVNFAPLLFLTFRSLYDIPLDKIAMLISINFGVQLLVDFAAAYFVDKIGYRLAIILAHLFSAAGISGMAILPEIMNSPYMGLVCSFVLFAVGGGLIEVLISPIVEACPTDNKSANMNILHSFYSWGQAGVILLSTLFFVIFGIDNWKILSIIWTAVPVLNAIYFLFVPINHPVEGGKGLSVKELFKTKIFYIFVLLMICSGAAEQALCQWASAFTELGLGVSKSTGDLLGPCMFAILMGISRISSAKLEKYMGLRNLILCSALLCIVAYLLATLSTVPIISLIGCALCGFAVGSMWPGTLSLASARCPNGGTAMFAFLALAGDLGCSFGPGLVGIVSTKFNDSLSIGLLSAIVFPIVIVLLLLFCKRAFTNHNS